MNLNSFQQYTPSLNSLAKTQNLQVQNLNKVSAWSDRVSPHLQDLYFEGETDELIQVDDNTCTFDHEDSDSGGK